MKLTYIKPIALALAGLLAAPLPLAWANNNSQERILQDIYNDKGQIIGQTRNAAPGPTVPVSDPGYKLSKLSHKTDTIDVFYPQVDLSNMITSVLVNYQLFQVPGRFMADLAPSAKLNMDYTVTRQEQNLISVVFRGEQTQDNSSKPLMASVNYNLKTRIPITSNRLIQDTDKARQGVNRLLQQAAISNPAATGLPGFSDKLGYYLTGKYVVFYYQPSESPAKFVELPVSIDLLRPYLSDEYRTLAVTNEVNKDPRQVIADIDKSLASYQSVSGKRGEGDTATDFTAYFENDQLVYAEESLTKDYESGIEKYYFEGGKLVAYKKSGKNLIAPIGDVATVQREEVNMFYDASLNVADGELIINDAVSKLPESYIKAAYAVAEEIQNQSADLLTTIKK
ncbi:hypothetical protein AXX12_06310 [Anaerosporomusa subterranea]|uniref:Uncharacterized protein n=1 Tax=Anaerosporomusa subterranea TaxID=1794912 RepID=A0A154BPV9_ANASB|nr:hypothetical protein [Anaerosporomusa subterranea]KYZ76053.1 hypothetical protein AXX12_06310 [Anaerosporomusa subterranea]